jgi:hypothetical protein
MPDADDALSHLRGIESRDRGCGRAVVVKALLSRDGALRSRTGLLLPKPAPNILGAGDEVLA